MKTFLKIAIVSVGVVSSLDPALALAESGQRTVTVRAFLAEPGEARGARGERTYLTARGT
jgi:hypothetical protein